MKIRIDEKNRCVIATGTFHGKRLKAVALCSKDDVFDEEIGKKIVSSRYKILEEEYKRKSHTSYIKALHKIVSWAFSVIENETKIVNSLTEKIDRLKKEAENQIENLVG